MPNKYTEGLEQVADGIFRIRENFSITKDILSEIKNSEGSIIETSEGSKSVIKSYRMKVWESKEASGALNKNGRYYDSIFERVLETKPVTLALMDHPDGNNSGSPKDIWAVQKSPMIENGWLTVQVDFVGDYGKLAEEVLEAGGAVAISSSCLGRVNEDGGIVNDNSFVLERFGDWILEPSNGVHHYKAEIENTSYKATESVVKENSTIILEDTDSNVENIKEKNRMEDNRLVRINLKSMIREAKKADSAKEKLELLEEALSFCGDENLKDLRESVSQEIEVISESIQARAVEADTLEESVKEKEVVVKEKATEVSKLKAITESLKKNFNRTKVILEKQTELKEEVEQKLAILERDNQELMAQIVGMKEAEDKDKDKKDKEKDPKDKKDDKEKDDEEEEEELEEKEMTPAQKKAFADNQFKKGGGKAKDDDKKDDKEDEDKEDKKDKKKESVVVDNKIRSFYLDAKRNDDSLREHRKDILACGSLKEAQELVLKLSNIVESTDKVISPDVIVEKDGVKSVSSITEKYRKDWSL